MESSPLETESDRRVLVVVVALALVKLLTHLLTNAFGSYGIFRDELYYLACAHRLDLGYVDQPPLSIDSSSAIRSLPSVCFPRSPGHSPSLSLVS